jgi:hypothetical protein
MRPGAPAVRSSLVGIGVVLLLTAGVTASAVWGGAGRGLGGGRTGTAVPVTLSPGTPAGDLRPGGRTDVLLTVTNPNPFSVRLGAFALDPGQGQAGFAVDSGHPGCGVSELSYVRQTNGGVGWTVPARGGTIDGTLAVRLPDALAMSLSAANACQGARITAYLVVGS